MRVGSWITLGLTFHELGDSGQTRVILRTLMSRAPGLMIEAHRALRSRHDDAFEVDARSDTEIFSLLTTAQALMKGNRSAACVTFVDASGRLRFVPPHGVLNFVPRALELAELQKAIESL